MGRLKSAGKRAAAILLLTFVAIAVVFFLRRSPGRVEIQGGLPAPLPQKLKPGGAPLGEETPAYTNQTLHRLLQEESARLGLRTGPIQERRSAPFLAAPGNADAAIQEFARMRFQIEQASGKPKAVPIDGKIAPVLENLQDPGGQSIEEESTRKTQRR